MRAQDIIRAVLDLIDQDEHKDDGITGSVEIKGLTPNEEEPSRFRQIFDLLSNNEPMPTANTPNEKYADVDAVTTLAGGGPNAPKHPHDIRVKDPSMYPNQQEY